MARATWNNAILAESDKTVVVEGNHYFPPDSIRREHFKPSSTHTTCSWKGVASYYDVEVNGQVNKDAAWYYPAPLEAAKQIAGHVAFWKGVQVQPGARRRPAQVLIQLGERISEDSCDCNGMNSRTV